MDPDRRTIDRTLSRALAGKGSHAATRDAFAGVTWKMAGCRPEGAPHTLFQLLGHIVFWQDWGVKWLQGQSPAVPRHASGSWPKATGSADRAEWTALVRRFRSGLTALDRLARAGDPFEARGRNTRIEVVQAIASHNSYHVGQAVVLRQQLGAWPPPSGGLTW